MDDREMWLATTLVELTDIRHADFDDAAYAHGLAERLAELLSPAEIGLLMTDGVGGGMVIAGASTRRVGKLLALESRYGDGPCTACYRTGQRVLNEPLTSASSRWPRFSPAARAAGFLTASALPMRRRAAAVGAVAILNTSDRVTAEPEARLAQLVAEAATVGILQERALRLSIQASAQLQGALDSRVLIEQAKGVVAARLGIEPSAAFELLRAYARRHNRKLAEVSSDAVHGLVETRDLMIAAHAGRRGADGPRRPDQSR
jgi:ANTAR domain/GAF domain